MNILFVCEGNINRSQMAGAFLHKLLPNVTVSTAGTLVPPEHEGKHTREVSTKGIEVMQEIGLDMRDATMHRLTPAMVDAADRVILVGPTPGGPLPEFLSESSKLEMWNVPDPGYGFISHTAARDSILEHIQQLVHELEVS